MRILKNKKGHINSSFLIEQLNGLSKEEIFDTISKSYYSNEIPYYVYYCLRLKFKLFNEL